MFWKIGHRGAAGYEPENTLRSFARALAMGVDMIELDVHRTKDGKIVVIHDESVDRTTNGRGKVNDLAFAEIRALDAGKGEKIPTLDEVLDLVGERVPVNVEIKDEGLSKDVADILNRRIAAGAKADDFFVSSFIRSEIADVGNYADVRRILLTLVFASSSIKEAAKLHLWGIGPREGMVNKRFIRRAHAKNLKVLVWAVDEPAEIQAMAAMGVDGIYSNFPDRLREVAEQPAAKKPKAGDFAKFAISVIGCELAGVIGAIYTAPAIASWYAGLIKPSFTPPSWLFGPVWTFLYLLMGIALFLVWKRERNAGRREALGVFAVQLVLNVLWSVIFFGSHSPFAAFVAIVALWIAIIATIMSFRKISRAAAWILMPYLLWVTFAAVLNVAIVILN